jgi:hypothetical protein
MLSATTLPPAARAALEAEAVAIETPEDLRPRPLVSRTWSGVLRNRLEVSTAARCLRPREAAQVIDAWFAGTLTV